MPKYTLTYFDMKGRAESLRLAFAIGKIEFEDRRLKQEEWAQMKQEGKAKFGQLPVLEIDGKQYAQSKAIGRYIGKLTGLYPQNFDQQLIVDEGMDLVEDIIQKIALAVFFVTDEKEKLEARKKLQGEILPIWLGYYEKQISEGQSGFYGEKLSVADIAVYQVLNWITSGVIDNFSYNLDQHKLLKTLQQTIKSIPEVQAWETAHK